MHTFLRNLYLVRSLSPEQISAHAVTVYVYALQHVKLVPQVQGMIQDWIARILTSCPCTRPV